ncbi:MAG: DUF5686 family protein [Parabacteroides sp.]|nr:DUF5686 family protein [Parabacteroides sp.]
MKKYINIIILLFIAAAALANPDGSYGDLLLLGRTKKTVSSLQGDSIMNKVIEYADKYRTAVNQYEAEIYIKGKTKILKRNALMHFAHHLFPVDRKNKDMIFEMVSHSKFNAPNNYRHNFKALYGNSIPNGAKQQEVLAFLNLNVYSPTIYNEGIIMPVAREAFKFYNFNLESIEIADNLKIYKIRFMPKLWSQKLICGDLYITDKDWRIDKIDVNGRFSFAEFNLVMTFGRDYRHFILPQKADLFLRYHVLGNAIASSYHTSFKYDAVEWVEEDYESKKHKSLDLTGYYRLSSDTIPIISDSSYWNRKRDIPLTGEEEKKYEKKNIAILQKSDTGNIQRYLKITEKLTNTINLDYKTTRLKYSGILNPFQLGYSGRNGITYKQQIRFSKTFKRDRQLRFHPEVGFVFKRKELFFKFGGDWEYLPEKRGALSLSLGNTNQGYSSKIMNEINEQLKDSAFNFDNLDLQYFKHYYIELRNQIELFNGFQLTTGVSYHHRTPTRKSAIDPGDGVTEIINDNYDDFIQTIGISYTPRQYYWMDGHRKEYLYSYYPTISLEYGKAIPGVWNSSGNYGRIEADIHQSIYLGLSRRFNYHVSGGIYTDQKSTYFADYRYFTRNNFPESWGGDDFGGVFHQLRSVWFNASDKYAQAHIMYESPFMLIQLIKPEATKHIISERFYLSQLWMPVKPSYTEIGYGFGNHIFNVAAFVGFDKLKYDGIGFKFAFELFQ